MICFDDMFLVRGTVSTLKYVKDKSRRMRGRWWDEEILDCTGGELKVRTAALQQQEKQEAEE